MSTEKENFKIEKKIHYCWFGNNPLPKMAIKCIKSWKKFCPDYEIVRWDESNFDISKTPVYVQRAYELKKWAFVCDYVRLYVVYMHGGLYLDTDIQMIKPFDRFLAYDCFFGFESTGLVSSGNGFGAIKFHPLIKKMLDIYNDIDFDEIPCPTRNSQVLEQNGFLINNQFQEKNGVAIFPSEYFCPKNWKTNDIIITKNTYSIHHFSASWWSKSKKKSQRKRIFLYKCKKFAKTILKAILPKKAYYKVARKCNGWIHKDNN